MRIYVQKTLGAYRNYEINDTVVSCVHWCCTLALSSVFFKAVCCKIGPTLWRTGSTGFVKMSRKDAFSWQFSQFLIKANDFGAKTLLILSNFIELAQAQKA